MSERPIHFTAESIKAILAGRKTQTRRVVTRINNSKEFYIGGKIVPAQDYITHKAGQGALKVLEHYCPYGQPGDSLWVKTGRFMPKAQARLWLELTGVGLERLQDISEHDCCRETGAPLKWPGPGPEPYHRQITDAFAYIWDSINAKRGWPWASNPWVWVLEFERIPAPAD